VATLSLGDLGTQFSDLNLNFDARELKLQLMLDEVRSHASQPFSSLPILLYLKAVCTAPPSLVLYRPQNPTCVVHIHVCMYE
jgi:hypothetical protein